MSRRHHTACGNHPESRSEPEATGHSHSRDLRFHQGHLFVFEGPDGVGKTTVAAQVSRELSALRIPVTSLASPGREEGSLGAHVYELHHHPSEFGVETIPACSLQILHLAAHLEAIDLLIRPAIDRGQVVLLDRFWWSIWVYGITAGVGRERLEAIIEVERISWGNLKPDLVFLLERRGTARLAEGDESAPLEREKEYAALAERESRNHPVAHVNNNRPLRKTVNAVLGLVQDRLIDGAPGDPDPEARR